MAAPVPEIIDTPSYKKSLRMGCQTFRGTMKVQRDKLIQYPSSQPPT
jgi:hypothetical protein